MEVNCDFSDDNVAYKCFVNNVEISNPHLIKNFLGEHNGSRTNDDVVSLSFISCGLTTFPRNLTKFFPNLAVIEVISCNLSEISKDDLRFYSKLSYLGIVDNQLKHLPSDLFENTPNIQFIDLSCNQITSIGPRIFDPIKNLKFANFCHNKNIDTVYERGAKLKLENLVKIIKKNCRPMETLKGIAATKLTESINHKNAIEIFFFGSLFDIIGMKTKAFLYLKKKMMPKLDEKMLNDEPGKVMKCLGQKMWGSK